MFWKQFPKKKPKNQGWYTCTIKFNQLPIIFRDHKTLLPYKYFVTVMDLYWTGDKWLDNRRMEVFSRYNVMDLNQTRVHFDDGCDRTDEVITWKKLRKPYTSKYYIDLEKY